jgi:YD repeat-containing protein
MLITGVVDGNGTQYSTYTYDQQGRGTSTSLAGGYETYKMNYVMSDPNSTAWETDVTDPLGTVRHKHYAVSTNGIQLTGNDQPGGSGCDAATESAVYDSYGNKYQEGDFNGNLVCHAYDLTTKLMTTTVEGLSASNAASYCSPLARAGTQFDLSAMPAGARATSYAWHPVWRLRAKVASPLQLTTYVYNGQPDPFHGGALANCVSGNAQLPDGSPLAVLCEAVTQATKDATGAAGLYPVIDSTVPARSVSYSYDALGKVLSRTDSLNHTTTYSYYQDKTTDHNVGDLWKVTNAANQVTTYTKYDAAGRVLQTVEPNGVTTDITYTARGLPYTITKTPYGGGTAMSTTFGYDLADQLKTVVGSDGTSLTYGYDDAHHLKTITDAAGNTVTYTLDNAGNRTGEDVKDVSGNLATTVTRVFDALGRLQAVTGALN